MELNDKEVSSFSRSNACKQLDSDILISFFNEARTPYKYTEFPEKIWAMKCSYSDRTWHIEEE